MLVVGCSHNNNGYDKKLKKGTPNPLRQQAQLKVIIDKSSKIKYLRNLILKISFLKKSVRLKHDFNMLIYLVR